MTSSNDSMPMRWLQAFFAVFTAARDLLIAEYPLGIIWNGKGEDLSVVIDKL